MCQNTLESLKEARSVSCGSFPSQIMISLNPAAMESKHLHGPQVETVPNTDPHLLGAADLAMLLGLDLRTSVPQNPQKMPSVMPALPRLWVAVLDQKCFWMFSASFPSRLFNHQVIKYSQPKDISFHVSFSWFLLTGGRSTWKEKCLQIHHWLRNPLYPVGSPLALSRCILDEL